MDYKVVSQQVVDNVGGLENIEGATHCVTRLRLVLKDTSKYNKAELENIDGVKGVLYNSGQLMIIFGTGTVNKVYDEFMALTGVKEISASEVKGAEADKKGKFFSVLKVFSDIFIPIIPAFVGAAIIIGLKSLIVANGLFGMEGSLADHSEFLKNLASFFAIIATTFDYLPVLVMYSAVKRFGGNPILGILVGIVMVHPSLMNRNTFVMDPTGAEYWNFGPLSIPMVAFQGGVFPAILTAWFMAKVEKIAQKYIPEVVSFVFVPTVTLILANVALFTVFGPLGNLIGDVLAGVIDIPSLMNRNTFVMDPTGAEYWNFGPLSIPMVAFQGGVFPAILTAWFMAKVEKIAQKYIPEVVSFVFVPTVTLILANVALFTVFGPLGNLIGDVLAGVIDILYNRMGVFGAFVFAAFLQPLVVTGTHQFIQGIEANLVATTGFNYIQAIWSVSIIAQGGGAIGMYLIHKKHSKERNICMSSFIPTLVGISEPAIFAANMRYSIIPFICACIGAGCGGAFVKLFEVRAIGQGLTGVLGLLIVTPETLVWYVAGNLIAFIVPIVLIFAYNKAKGVPTTDEEGAGAGFDVSF